MITKRNFLTASALLILFGCAVQQNKNIQKTEWLIGTWEHKTAKGSIYETWRKTVKNELTGKSYILKNNDTIVFEEIRLVEENGKLYYIPAVKDQNGGQPVRFESRLISQKEFVFENRTHDFPQVISYQKINEDSLNAEISGLKNGKENRRKFPMKRIK
ncbi:DUF6265 family protein [Chryseobacterium sp. FH1]|uniref:DUF6265 family protein n=1 Tax=Chryseobacterium sp. FH1 TaxID=1233951 RepID=UPI0004E3D082|nr:DUF6265 family protein [Chryseobacterium sp. FH1]KFC19556.1 hypothetical protein IO90_09740 [Chryseobacterium sp. FH1]